MPSIILADTLRSIDSSFQRRLLTSKVSHTNSFGGRTRILGVYPTDVLLPHPDGSLALHVEFFVLDGSQGPYQVLLGEDTLRRYAVNVVRSLDTSKPTVVK